MIKGEGQILNDQFLEHDLAVSCFLISLHGSS